MTLQIIEKTMDSREIAELTEKEHRNVLRDIEAQLGQLEGGLLRFEHTYTNQQNGQEYRCYKLPYRETMILISGYSVELRAKVVDRWMELEQASANTPQFPTGIDLFARAVLEAKTMIDNQAKQIDEMKPKADFYDAVTGSKNAVHLGDVAKNLDFVGVGRNNLFQYLRDKNVLMSNNQPYQEFVDRGLFRVVQSSYTNARTGGVEITYTTHVYQKGVDFIRKALLADGFKQRVVS